jgi:hypothetical protein
MAGNPKTPKSTAPSWAEKSKSKGVMVGVNKGATLPGNKTQSTASVGKKKK